MSATNVRFNVGGTVFEVAVSTIQSQPEGLLAKMIDGRFQCGKDASGAFFIDRNHRFFDIVLDVHRDNKVYPLTPLFTRERVLAELEFYGLQDFCEGAPIDLSLQATVQSMQEAMRSLQQASNDFSQWQLDQKRIGNNMLTEGFARLCLAGAQMGKEGSPATLTIPPLQLANLPMTPGVQGLIQPCANAGLTREIVKLFGQWDLKATPGAGVASRVVVQGNYVYSSSIFTLEPAKPDVTLEEAQLDGTLEPAKPAAGA
ncbi:BTB/POZ protein [Baffinella frigidus]|nr:BTB/POZ protein [Cryptophyta sp. CCMP2293]